MKIYVVIALTGDEINYVDEAFLHYKDALAYLDQKGSPDLSVYTQHAGETYKHSDVMVIVTPKRFINTRGQPDIVEYQWQILEMEVNES